jgi:hypothetical protein
MNCLEESRVCKRVVELTDLRGELCRPLNAKETVSLAVVKMIHTRPRAARAGDPKIRGL